MGLRSSRDYLCSAFVIATTHLSSIARSSGFVFLTCSFIEAGTFLAFLYYFVAVNFADILPVGLVPSQQLSSFHPIPLSFQIASQLSGVFAMVFMINLSRNLKSNSQLNAKKLLTSSFRLIVPALWISILSAICTLIGGILLIVPAILFSIWFYFSLFALVIDKKHSRDALRYSRGLVLNHFWPTTTRLGMIAIAHMLGSFILLSLTYLISRLAFFIANQASIDILTNSTLFFLSVAVLSVFFFASSYLLRFYLTICALEVYNDLQSLKQK